MLSSVFFEHRRLLVLTVGVIIVAGLTAAVAMPRMEDPELTQRAAMVTTALPGAPASRVESLVAEKIIDELREVEEIKELQSASRPSISSISIILKDEVYEVDEVWARIRDRLEDVQDEIPSDAETPDLSVIQTRAYARIFGIAWQGEGPPAFDVLARTADELKETLRDVPGTELVEIFGEPEEELLVEIDSEQLRGFGLSAADVANQISNSDPKVSAGQIRGERSDMLLEVGGELDSLQQIGNISLRSSSTGQSLLLRDVARIERSIVTPPTSLALVDGRRGILVGAVPQSVTRIDMWSKRVDQNLSEFTADLPSGLRVENVFNQSIYVTQRLSELVANLVSTCLIVSAVVLFMLGWRIALVVSAALPLTGCMVLAGLRFLDIPLHQMSLTGLIISLGLLIDNAIVMADEVQHRVRNGGSALKAVRGACKQLLLPLTGSTATTAFSFAPIAMIPGPSGEFVGGIAISVILSICCSLFVSLAIVSTITAIAHCKTHDVEGKSVWKFGVHSDQLTGIYRKLLFGVFRFPIVAVASGLILPILGFIVAPMMKEQFFPPAERDQFQIEIELGSESAIAETRRTAERISEILSQFPEVERVDWSIGESFPSFYYNLVSRISNASRYGQAHVELRNDDQTTETINRIQRRLGSEITEAQCRARQLGQGPPVSAPIEVRIFGSDSDTLMELGEKFRARLAQDPAVIGTQADLSDSMAKLVYEISEQEAQLAGLELRQIANQLNSTLEGSLGGSIIEGTEELKTRVRLTGDRRMSVSDVGSVDIMDASGLATNDQTIGTGTPMDALGTTKLVPQLSLISRFNGHLINAVRAYTFAGVLPSTVLEPLKDELAKGGFELPRGYRVEFGGESSKRDEAVNGLWARIGLLILLMISALVLSLQSFRAATMIAAVAGLSFGLGFLSIWAFGYPRGFTGIVGTMGLIGIAINDSIVVLAALRRNQNAAIGERSAVVDVVVRETRHVLATTFTTIAGLVPLMMAGGSFWPPMVVAIAGGVLGATFLALATVPASHMILARLTLSQRHTAKREENQDIDGGAALAS